MACHVCPVQHPPELQAPRHHHPLGGTHCHQACTTAVLAFGQCNLLWSTGSTQPAWASQASRHTPQPRMLGSEWRMPRVPCCQEHPAHLGKPGQQVQPLEQLIHVTRDILHVLVCWQRPAHLGKPGQQVQRQHGQAAPLAGGAGAASAPVPRAPEGGLGCGLCGLCGPALHILPRVCVLQTLMTVEKAINLWVGVDPRRGPVLPSSRSR